MLNFFGSKKKDNRNKSEIYSIAKERVELPSFSPRVESDDNGKEEKHAGDVAKKAIPVEVTFKEVSLNA